MNSTKTAADVLRDEARALIRSALRETVLYPNDRWVAGRVSAFRSAARQLRGEAARLEGYDVTNLHGGPRSTELARRGLSA